MSAVAAAINKAVEHYRAGRKDAAEASLRQALAKDPKHPDANHLMARAMLEAGKPEQAEFFARRATAAKPDQPVFLQTLAACLGELGRHDEAAEVLGKARALAPADPAMANSLAASLVNARRLGEAEQVYLSALAHSPDSPELLQGHAAILAAAGRTDLALPLLERCAAQPPLHAERLKNVAAVINYAVDEPGRALAAHRRLAEVMAMNAPPAPAFARAMDPDRPLRIGFVSPDFRSHSCAYFLEPLLEHFGKAGGFEPVCYFSNEKADHITARFKQIVPAAAWHEVAGMGDAELAAKMRADGIDILLELAGFTSGSRINLLKHRPAPVQVEYLGYPSTTGLGHADWRIVDSITDGPGAEEFCVERLARLDPCFLCFRCDEAAGEPAARPAGGAAAFGSFNTTMKIGPRTAGLWARILGAVPGSRLVLKGMGNDDAWTVGKRMEIFEAAGVDRERVEILPYTKTVGEHFALYSRVDVALDSFPYNGTTTTCEALWMGVPVVALTGRSHAARVSTSILRAVGLPELGAASDEEYIRIACELAADGPRRAELRTSLRGMVRSSPLCDAPAFARRFEDVLRSMWRERCTQ